SPCPKSLWMGWRLGFGRAVGAGVRCAIVDVGSAVMKHGLAATHGGGVLLTNTEDMAHRGELLESLGRHAGLDEDVAAYFVTDGEAGFFNGGLNVHVVVDQVRDKLSVGERLIHAAHDPEADVLRAAFHEGWDDGAEGPLSAGQSVRGFGVKRKESATVLQDKTHTLDCDSGSKTDVVALNEREDVAFAIHDGKISGVAAGERARSDG